MYVLECPSIWAHLSFLMFCLISCWNATLHLSYCILPASTWCHLSYYWEGLPLVYSSVFQRSPLEPRTFLLSYCNKFTENIVYDCVNACFLMLLSMNSFTFMNKDLWVLIWCYDMLPFYFVLDLTNGSLSDLALCSLTSFWSLYPPPPPYATRNCFRIPKLS